MELFHRTVADPERADRLAIAIDGRGAFRRFKDVLGRWPGEIERWYAFSEERQRGGLAPGSLGLATAWSHLLAATLSAHEAGSVP